MARTGLARAASLGSAMELVLGWVVGQMSDTYGRKPLVLMTLVIPTMTRVLAVLVTGPRTRLQIMFWDLFCLRAFGMSQLVSLTQTMVSDAIPLGAQPDARGKLGAVGGLGLVLGSAFGGWCASGRRGPIGAYMASVCGSVCSIGHLALCLPETKPERIGHQSSDTAVITTRSKTRRGALATILSDPEARCLALAMTLHEPTILPQISEVTSIFAQERLGWGPMEFGRFISAYGVASMIGSLSTGRLVDTLGTSTHTTVCHLMSALSFVIWGCARDARSMAMVLPPTAVSRGMDAVLQGKLMARTSALGLGKGEASAACKILGASVKVMTPLALAHLYSASTGPKTSSRRHLPAGSPMFLVAAVVLMAEVFHRGALRAARERGEDVARC